METILITGGNGFVGQLIKKYWPEPAHFITLGRNGADFYWNPATQQCETKQWPKIDGVIHLAGANVAGRRWTASFKDEIYRSRIESTRLLAQSLQELLEKPRWVISASATGFYPGNSEDSLTEDHLPGNDFLSCVCRDWEKEAERINAIGVRTGIFRIGVVLARGGGYMEQMKKLSTFHALAYLGSVNGMTPWISGIDLVRMMYFFSKQENMLGVFNAVSEKPSGSKEILTCMARIYGTRIWLPPVPAWILKLIFGGFSAELLTNRKVVPQNMSASGFQWQIPDLNVEQLKTF